jgi:NADH-quinone oxidoreductase subunit H
MKFSMFFIAEYANMVTVSAMVATLFLGGWDIPFIHWDETPGLLQTLATGGAFFLKTFFFLYLFMWVRWTLPRFRYDQLMTLGWKVLLPLSLAYIVLLSVAIYLLQSQLGITDPSTRGWILFGLNFIPGYLLFFALDRGTLMSGSYRRAARAAVRG